MSFKYNNNIVPEKLYIIEETSPKKRWYIRGDICITYIKNKKGDIATSTIYNNFKHYGKNLKEYIIDNDMFSGFKVVGTTYQNDVLIKHPLFQKNFTITHNKFIEIIPYITIKNGEIEEPLIFTKDKMLITKEMYEKRLNIFLEKKEKNKKDREKRGVSGNYIIPGEYYNDGWGNIKIYLGSGIDDYGNKKHITLSTYIYSDEDNIVEKIMKNDFIKYYTNARKNRPGGLKTIKSEVSYAGRNVFLRMSDDDIIKIINEIKKQHNLINFDIVGEFETSLNRLKKYIKKHNTNDKEKFEITKLVKRSLDTYKKIKNISIDRESPELTL